MFFKKGFYKTTEGYKAEVLKTDAGISKTELLVYNYHEHDVKWYSPDGTIGQQHARSLVSEWKEPIIISGWVNLYAGNVMSNIYETRESANENAGPTRIACIHVRGMEE